MPKADIGDAEIYYEDTGNGEPVMLVPGLGGGTAAWAKQVEPFTAAGYRVIAHDHRGCGRSTFSHIEYSVDQMAADAVKLMDALGIERAHWVGHSTGGAMGQIVAEDYGDRLGGLVLSATWAGIDNYFNRAFASRKAVLKTQGVREYARTSLLTLLPPWFITQNDALMSQQEDYLAGTDQPVEIMESRIDAICRYDRRDRMKDIKAPTLVIVSEDDMVTPRYLSDELAEGIAGAEYVVLPTGGHFLMQVMAGEYNSKVVDFLDRHRLG